MTLTKVFLFISLFLIGVNMLEAFLLDSSFTCPSHSKPLTKVKSSPTPLPSFYNAQETGLRAPNESQFSQDPKVSALNGPPQQVANPYQQQNLPYVSYPNPNPYLSPGQGMGQVGQPDLQNAQNPGRPIPVNVQPNGLAVPPGGMNRFQKALEEYNRKHGIDKQETNDAAGSFATVNNANEELSTSMNDNDINKKESSYTEQRETYVFNTPKENIVTPTGQQRTLEGSFGNTGYQRQLQLAQERRQNTDQTNVAASSFPSSSSSDMKSSFIPQAPQALEKPTIPTSVPFQDRHRKGKEEVDDSSEMHPQEKIKALLRARVAGDPEKEQMIEKLIMSETTGVTSTKEDVTASYEKTLKTGGSHGFPELKGRAPPGMGPQQGSPFPPQQQPNMPNIPTAQNMQSSMPMMGQGMMPQIPPSPYPPFSPYGIGYPAMNLPFGGQGIDPMYYQQMMMMQQQQQQQMMVQQQQQQQQMMMQQEQQQQGQIANQGQSEGQRQGGHTTSEEVNQKSAEFSSEITGRTPPQGEPQYPLLLSGGEASLVEDSLPIIQDLIFDDGYVDEEKYNDKVKIATKYVNGLQKMLQNLQNSLDSDFTYSDSISNPPPTSMSNFHEDSSSSTSPIMSALSEENLDSTDIAFRHAEEPVNCKEVSDIELSEDNKTILNGASSMVLKHSGTFGNEPLLEDQELKLMQGSLSKAEAILRMETEESYGVITENDYKGYASAVSQQAQTSLLSQAPKKQLSYKEMLEQAKAKKAQK